MEDFFNQMLKATMAILAIDSVEAEACETSPFGKGVGECLNVVGEIANQLGFETHNEDGYYLTADVGKNECFGILGHVDVVPYGDDWSANPLGEIKNGRIFGRGILDDKGPMMCCLFATGQLLAEGLVPRKKIRFIFGGNEESGWRCIDKYNEVDTMPEVGFSPDGDFPVINCEKGLVHYLVTLEKPPHLVSICGGSRGNIVMESCDAVIDIPLDSPANDNALSIKIVDGKTFLHAVGKPAHASTPACGDNAAWHIFNYLSKTLGDEYERLARLVCHNDGSGCALKISDEKSGDLTFNLGVINMANSDEKCIHSNKKTAITHNMSPKMQLTIDIRHPITFSKEYVLDKLIEAFAPYKADITHFHNPHYIDDNSPLVLSLLSAYDKVNHSTNSKAIAIGGGTYARALKCGVAFGPIFPGCESSIHQKDENVDIVTFSKMYDIYYEAIKELCF